MLKKITCLALGRITHLFAAILLTLSISAQTYGNFPYEEGFKSTVQPSEISIPSVSSGVNSATFTNGGLQLTSAAMSQFGAVFVNSLQFETINGIKIEFEYMIYADGTVEHADGISVFLFDAEVTNPTIGAKGSGLGYTFNRTNNSNLSGRTPGLTGAYMGIGIDSYGNFKNLRFQPDSRVNGLPANDLKNSNVTIRGAKGVIDPSYNGANVDGYSGYPVLISQSTLSPSLNRKIDVSNGTYSSFASSINANETFSLRGGKTFDDGQTSNPAYRKAIVELYPWVDNMTNTVLGKLVTVRIQAGDKLVTVIQNFQYPESLTYIENSYTDLSTGDYNSGAGLATDKAIVLNTKAPDYVRVGFAASTGAYFDNHYIKNLRITLPSSAIALDDEIQSPPNSSVNIYPLTNDLGFTGIIQPDQIGNSSYLNSSTFRFIDTDGNPVAGYSYTNSNGTWVYDPNERRVTFTPVFNLEGEVKVRYDIKAGLNNEVPYADENYRSLPATITVRLVAPVGIVTNLMLQPTIIK